MKLRFLIGFAITMLAIPGTVLGTTPGTSLNVKLVGQNPLFGRGNLFAFSHPVQCEY